MNFKEYQKAAQRTWREHTTQRDARLNAALGLGGEAGEVLELVKKHTFHGRVVDRDQVCNELGDVLYYIAMLALECGVSLERVATANIEKLTVRYPNGYDQKGANHER